MKTFLLRFISVLVLVMWFVPVVAQELKIDSLKNLLSKVEKEEKVNVLTELSLEFFHDSLEKQQKYANQALEIARTLNYLKGEGKAFYSLSLYYLGKRDYINAEENIKNALEILLLHGDSMDISNSYRIYGYISTDISNYGDALDYLKKSISYLHNDSLRIRHIVLVNIGIVQFNLSNYNASLKILLIVLKYHEKNNNISQLGHIYSLISGIYIETGEKDLGLEYLKKAWAIGIEENDDYTIGEALLSIGSFHKEENQLDSALHYLYIAIEHAIKDDHKLMISDTYTEIGESYILLKNYDSAEFYFNKVLEVAEEVHDKWAIVYGNIGLAKVYKSRHDYNKALFYLNKVKPTAEEIKSKDMLKDFYEIFSEVYAQSGKYKDAYRFQLLYKNISDSLHDEETTKQLANLKVNYETEKKEQENKRLIVENVLNERTIANQKSIGAGIIVILLLAIVLALVFFNTKEKIRSANFLLKERNQEIQNQNEEITVQAEELSVAYTKLKELDEFKQGLTNMIVHDLKNPLNIILNLSEKQLVKEAGSKMLNLITNILGVSKFEEAKMNVNSEIFELNKAIKLSVEKTSFVASISKIEIINEADDHLKVEADNDLTERIFINLLTNAIKFSPRNAKIYISAKEILDNKYVKVFIKDSGSGIPEEYIDTIFEKFAQVTAIDSESMRSTGLGLTFCKLAVEAHGGKIGVESELKKGSTFWFTLPKG
ncbi:MAG: tetratricopeptide repeat-containing sensor histidine kinase [Bacteroidota bacterium]